MTFNKPHPLNQSTKSNWLTTQAISVFIALFLVVFQPFGLSNFTGNYKLIIIAGYGLITFVVLCINLLIIQPKFNEGTWTVFKHILWLLWILLGISVANYFYTVFMFNYTPISLFGFFNFLLYTFAVGIFPIVIATLISQGLLSKKHLETARSINIKPPDGLFKNENGDETMSLVLTGERNGFIETNPHNLLYIESKANYIYVSIDKDGVKEKTRIRSTLQNLVEQTNEIHYLFKCHRAFIVNLNKIETITGNAQGLQLKITNVAQEIPVSRNYVKAFKEAYNQ